MFEYTLNNHFKFGYDNEWFIDRPNKNSKWSVQYGQCNRPVKNWREECKLAASIIYDKRQGLPIDILFSGGMDSEITLRSFLEIKVPFNVHFVDYKGYNVYDKRWAIKICEFLNVKLKNPSLKIGVAIAVNIQNVLYLPELLSWIKQHSFDHYHFNIITSPKWISITQLTKSAQQLVLDKLLACELESEDYHNLQYIIQSVRNSSGSDGKDFVAHMRAKDQIRNENFATTHKEIAVAMGYYET